MTKLPELTPDQRAVNAAPGKRLDAWENEGGQLAPDTSLPEGIERRTSEIFCVGPYRYTSMTDAIAQLRRDQAAAQMTPGK